MKEGCVVFGLVDWRVFDEFSAKAKASPQLRMNIDQGIWLIMGPSGCGGARDCDAYP